MTELSKAFALCAAEEEALAIREDVGFFQAVKAGLSKHTVEGGKSRAELDAAVRQIVSRSVASDQVIDIFETAGLDKPELSILSDQFLEEVRDLPQKKPGPGSAAQAAQRRNQSPIPQERGPVPQLLRNAGSLHPSLPEPGHHLRRSDPGADQPGQGDERGQPPRGRPGPHRG